MKKIKLNGFITLLKIVKKEYNDEKYLNELWSTPFFFSLKSFLIVDILTNFFPLDFNGRSWKKIAERLPNRTNVQCLHRWQKVLNPELVKGPWTEEEDQKNIAQTSAELDEKGQLVGTPTIIDTAEKIRPGSGAKVFNLIESGSKYRLFSVLCGAISFEV